jgi:hypothetical protein
LDEYPVRRDAGLSRVAEFGQDTRLYRSLDLSVVENDERTVPAKLKRELRQVVRALSS